MSPGEIWKWTVRVVSSWCCGRQLSLMNCILPSELFFANPLVSGYCLGEHAQHWMGVIIMKVSNILTLFLKYHLLLIAHALECEQIQMQRAYCISCRACGGCDCLPHLRNKWYFYFWKGWGNFIVLLQHTTALLYLLSSQFLLPLYIFNPPVEIELSS